jgi:hypothetical protein
MDTAQGASKMWSAGKNDKEPWRRQYQSIDEKATPLTLLIIAIVIVVLVPAMVGVIRRSLGNILIAVGAIMPGFGGAFSRSTQELSEAVLAQWA